MMEETITNPELVVKLHNVLQNCLPNLNSTNQCSICNEVLPTTTTDKEFTAGGFTSDKDKQLLLLKFYQTFNLEYILPKEEEEIKRIQYYCKSCNEQLIKMQQLEQKVKELNQLVNELQDKLMTLLVKSRIKDSLVVEGDGGGVNVLTDTSIAQFVKDLRKCRQDLQTNSPSHQDLDDSKVKLEPQPRRSGRIRSRNTTASPTPTTATYEPTNSFGLKEMQELNLIQDIQKQDLYPDVELEEIKLEPIDLDHLDFDLASNNMLDHSDLSAIEFSSSESDSEPDRSCRKRKKYTKQNIKKAQPSRNIDAAGLYKKPPPKIPRKETKSSHKYTCEVCGIVYKKLVNFKNHMYEHKPSENGFPCKICGVLFDKPLQVKNHLHYVHGNGKRKHRICQHCGKQISNVRQYRLHLYKQHKEEYLKDKPFYCKICHNVFKTQEELDKDIQRHLKCQYCDYRFTDKLKLSEHENVHTGHQPHQCAICGRRFKQAVCLAQHLKIHTRDSNPADTGLNFLESNELDLNRVSEKGEDEHTKFKPNSEPKKKVNLHSTKRKFASQPNNKKFVPRKRTKSSEPKTFKCTYGCRIRTFRTRRGQRKHYYLDHKETYLESNPFYCRLCFESFRTQEMLNTHNCSYVLPPSKQARQFACEVCGKIYNSPDNFANHMYEHEPSKNGFPCEICGTLFDKPLQLKSHSRYVHGNGKDLCKNRTCPYCRKHTTDARQYRLHLYKQHKEEYLKDKPFYCKICHHVFKTQEELDKDYQRHYKCQYCDKRFSEKIRVSEHENIHTGLQPHQCAVCGKRFNKLVNLTQHMKIHTGERPYHCEICPERIGFFRKRELDKHNQKFHSLQTL